MNINPALRQTLELAALVQPHCAATGAVPGDELNFGRVCAGVMVHSHLQPQPFRAGLKIDACRPVRRVPGGETDRRFNRMRPSIAPRKRHQAG